FAMEYGLHECLPLYSGGLGMLSGDHLKSASELGVPLCGVGLLYQAGYFRQYLNMEGYQQESYTENDFSTMPLVLVRDEDGSPVKTSVDLPGRVLWMQVWKIDVGRIRLFLLDTNIEENSRTDQNLTDFLYGGDAEMRICQEIILGIGGPRSLCAMGVTPTVFHMNEGHAAFLGLERIRTLMKDHSIGFETAREIASASNCFTTHTPVPAGSDSFAPELMEHFFSSYHPELGLDFGDFLALGQTDPEQSTEHFNMTVLALRLSQRRNGVSRLHGETSRSMWQVLWPALRTEEVPITHVTNGVFHKTWLSPDMRGLFDRYLGPKWREDPADPAAWQHAASIPAVELWRTHETRRARLVAYTRRRLQKQLEQRNASSTEVAAAGEALSPEALTIGFARRFAAYKRATLLFHDPERLERIVGDAERPVQFIIAGKAHPKDEQGKDLIRRIVGFAREDRFRHRIVFLENYNMEVARYMLQGVDVWLNTPRRPNEASGTSGMKAVVNGAIHMSVLDGWWDEAYERGAGWAIGKGEMYEDTELQDEVEVRAIYDILEKEAVRLFYDRGPDDLPRGWVELMKTSLVKLCPTFNSNRMVKEYTTGAYTKAHRRHAALMADSMRRARALTEWKSRVREAWPQVDVKRVDADLENPRVGEAHEIKVEVFIGDLDPSDVAVQVHRGPLDQHGNIVDGTTIEMEACGSTESGVILCTSAAPLRHSGRQGFTIRVIPRHEDLEDLVDLPLVVWG
ncbi:MAG: alpha-glucan family phosphorylase, partial [Deltaproteobacteria bacterium]|nr:alpha-glucan family phosphorylase [Deltaproteobacteria bacterium]